MLMVTLLLVSVGIAAATIAAGIALIVGTQASIKDATNSQTYQRLRILQLKLRVC